MSGFGTSLGATFLAAFVECVEAFTIVLAVASIHGWRRALAGAACGAVLLLLLGLGLGPTLLSLPLPPLRIGLGLLLLLFGTRWLRKAILRRAGRLALRDEAIAFGRETERARAIAALAAAITAGKAVLIEGLEVLFLVLAIGAGDRSLVPASIGAGAAVVTVIGLGLVLHRPLTLVPENTLKFLVGALASGFGIFWIGEGLGWPWPGGDAALPVLALAWGGLGLMLVEHLRRPA